MKRYDRIAGYEDQGPNEIKHAFHYASVYFDIAGADEQGTRLDRNPYSGQDFI